MSDYLDAVKQSMQWLGLQPDVVMLGQGIGHKVGGTFMSKTLDLVPQEKKLEFPVAESFQLQFSIGLALGGYIPISIYPRFNFLLLATSDIINMLDKMNTMDKECNPKVIIRTAVGLNKPGMDPQAQHKGDFTYLFLDYTQNIRIYNVRTPLEVKGAYEEAYHQSGSSLIIEHGNLY